MYELLSQISAWISGPFSGLAYSTNFTILTSFLLGFVGSVAPCQISANLGAVAYFGNRYVQQKTSLCEKSEKLGSGYSKGNGCFLYFMGDKRYLYVLDNLMGV